VNLESIRTYCLAKPGKVTEDFPFDEETLVFRVSGKIFLLTSMNDRPLALNLKCNPEQAIEWREQYEAVQPGYHMNKRHWNTVTLDGRIPRDKLLSMIDHSFGEVVRGLKKSERQKIKKSSSGKKTR
jgi:predicted DNA-binding protein (MmcQ/YjbR family)